MKINRIIAFFLAFVMALAMLTLTACDGESAGTTTNDEGSLNNPSSNNPASNDQTSGDGNTQGSGISEEAFQALKDAFERTEQATNYTQTDTISGMTNMTLIINGEQEEITWEEGETSEIYKHTEDKEECKTTSKERSLPDGEWEYSNDWYFYHYTTENSGISYSQHEGTWYTGSFSHSNASNDSDDGYETALFEDLESIRNKITYDEGTGVYTIAELEMENVIEWFFGSHQQWNILSGTATGCFRNVRIELRDGYVYSFSCEYEATMDNLMLDAQGQTALFNGVSVSQVATILTDFGTTVVTLPNVNVDNSFMD